MRWWSWASLSPTTAPADPELKPRAHDHALLIGKREYHPHLDTG